MAKGRNKDGTFKKGNKISVGNKGGRPTYYKEEYCEKLISHMAKGYSYQSFAGLIQVNQDTLFEWEKKHPEFSESKKIGRSMGLFAYERLIMSGAKGEIENFNPTAAIWFGKNVYDWRDKKDVNQTNENIEIKLNYKLDE